MAATSIGPELIDQIARDLAERYSLDAAAIREVGRCLAGDLKDEEAETRVFVERMLEEHKGTFERLSR
jgi:hypothetical protein